MKGMLGRVLRNPLGTLLRGFEKLLIAPIRYGKGNDYDAARYWRDRFVRHGSSLKSVGDEGLDEMANARMYADARERVGQLVLKSGMSDPGRIKVLEIGCGNGFYTQLLDELGIRDFCGLDITDVFFPMLQKQYPAYKFIQGDVTSDVPQANFDLVLCIDVIEHIVTPEKFRAAMANLDRALRPGGHLFIAPVIASGRRSLFYVRFWSEQEVLSSLPGYEVLTRMPFRYSQLFVLRKLLDSGTT